MQFSNVQNFQHFDKYSKVVDGRRTTYLETVSQTLDFLFEYSSISKNLDVRQKLYSAMAEMSVFPSLRLFNQTPAAIIRDNTVAYNCSAINIDSWHAVASVLYLSMSGVGVGEGIEQATIDKLPSIKPLRSGLQEIIVVDDSQFGWATAFWYFMELYANGVSVLVDTSKIRPEGAVLKTKNGIASGPKPLQDLFNFTKKVFDTARGRKLTVTEIADLITYVGGIAVSGGARRSANILLGDNSQEFINIKYPGFHKEHPHRSNSNNSVILKEWYPKDEFEKFLYVFETENGEPGLFSQYSAIKTKPERRNLGNSVLTNPCGEVSLQPDEFCNLTQVNMRSDWTTQKLYEMVEIATIIGTIQSMFDHFLFISPQFRHNAREERLLGVGLSNVFAAMQFANPMILRNAKRVAIDTNRKWANYFGIAPSAAITTIKPSGNSSLLGNLASPGLHPSFGKYLRRNIRVESYTPMGKFLEQNNWPLIQHPYNHGSYLAQFYQFSGDIPTTKEISAIEHLNLWKMYKTNWTEHNVSCSIYYGKEEILQIKDWLFENQDIVNGLSFMLREDYDYPYSPIENITKEEYFNGIKNEPIIDWNSYATFDVEHHVQKSIVECSGDSCVISYE